VAEYFPRHPNVDGSSLAAGNMREKKVILKDIQATSISIRFIYQLDLRRRSIFSLKISLFGTGSNVIRLFVVVIYECS
jgi:hypothetical protein